MLLIFLTPIFLTKIMPIIGSLSVVHQREFAELDYRIMRRSQYASVMISQKYGGQKNPDINPMGNVKFGH